MMQQPRRVLVDKEAALAFYAPSPHGDLLVPLEFSVPLMPQARCFPPMTLEAFQAFTTYWYGQA